MDGQEKQLKNKKTVQLDKIFDRVPPQALEAETAVLGSILIDSECLSRVIEILGVESFYKKAHQKIYSATLELYEKNEP